MKLKYRKRKPARIELMPLIDVIFLLLVFFIYTMLSMTVHHGQQVNLPESDTAGLEMAEAVGITIQAANGGLKLFVDEEPVELLQLKQLLEQKKTASKDKNPDVQIFADKSVSYQGLFQVLDQIRQAGLTSISLQAEAETTTP
ncbi:Biopolymer transport protein ExbD [Candidatus Electrothrix laxa]